MIITNNISNVNSPYLTNPFQNTSLEENLKILGEIAHAEYNEDFKSISELTEKLHPDFKQRLRDCISSVGFLSKAAILQIQAEVCVEALLESVHKADTRRVSELLDQLVWIDPRNKELYKFLWEICNQPDLEGWGEHAFHDRPGYFATISDKAEAIFRFKTFLEGSWVRNLLASNPTLVRLEKEFENQGCLDIDLDKDCGFRDYLEPNEGKPQNIIPHLLAAQTSRGIVVCTGTERLFFDLLFSNKKTCQGMVGRDINPKVKAYVDFNTALLRISKTVQEYAELSGKFSWENKDIFNKRVDVITNKIETSNLDTKIKKYYLENIRHFGEIYFRTSKSWRDFCSEYFECCRYDRDEQLFSKLKRYADSGNIVCIVGDINDVAFLKNRKITVIDTSNIRNYCCLDFKGEKDFQPRIIWTRQDPFKTDYYSRVFNPLSDRERVELNELCNIVKDTGVTTENMVSFLDAHLASRYSIKNPDPLNSHTYALYSVETLNALRDYIDKFFLKIPRLGFVSMDFCGNCHKKLNNLSIAEINELCQDPKTKRFLEYFVNNWVDLDPRVYLAFSKIEGWKDQFEISFSDPRKSLSLFLERLREHNLLEEFTLEFGEERLDSLISLYHLIKEIEVSILK